METKDIGPTGLKLRTVYITNPEYMLAVRSGHLNFRANGKLIGKLPLMATRQLVLMEGVPVTTGVLEECLSMDIPVTFLDREGRVKGHLVGNRRYDPSSRLAQFRAWHDPARKLDVARRIVDAKLANTSAFLRRQMRNHSEDCEFAHLVKRIKQRRNELASARTEDQIRGVEGITAKEYFDCFGDLIRKTFTFSGRNRRPPKDPVNALLSFGYTLLAQECAGVSEAFGLDSYVGFLHEVKSGRPSLALDLIEPLRVAIVDRMVIGAINLGTFTYDDFQINASSDGAVLLNKEGRSKFFANYEKWMTNCQKEDEWGEDWWAPRSVMEEQCETFRRAILDDDIHKWEPFHFDPKC